uniref:UBC core domain-containing protein n=1 Tax=Acrobeloides nanus TaxID=290746 RepID=A0A914DHE1_9BILA
MSKKFFGTAGTPYEDGYYHGKLIFPSDFPFKPPRILMLTPSGRFATNTALCFSISDHHPESWNPTWTVSTIIMGIVSFMNDEREQTYGSMNTPAENRRKHAKNSKKFNLKSSEFCQIFPDLVPVLSKKVKEEKTEETNSIDKEACSSESELEEAEYENQ